MEIPATTSSPIPLRQQILEAGLKGTLGDRNKSYGDPVINLGLAGTMKQAMRDYYSEHIRTIGPAEWEALDMVVTKLARALTGANPGRDTYIDGATYFAIAGEAAEREKRNG